MNRFDPAPRASPRPPLDGIESAVDEPGQSLLAPGRPARPAGAATPPRRARRYAGSSSGTKRRLRVQENVNDRETSCIDDAMAWDINWRCATFVAKYRGGDPGVLAALYRRHLTDVSHIVRNGFGPRGAGRVFIPGISSHDESDDLVQEVFSRVFSSRARTNFDPGRPYEPYLRTIGRHALVDYHRTNGKRRRLDRSFREVMRLAESHCDVIGCDPQPQALVEAYVDTLARPVKDVFEQIFVCGRSQRQAAQALGLSRQNVRTLEQRLRAGIKRTIAG